MFFKVDLPKDIYKLDHELYYDFWLLTMLTRDERTLLYEPHRTREDARESVRLYKSYNPADYKNIRYRHIKGKLPVLFGEAVSLCRKFK